MNGAFRTVCLMSLRIARNNSYLHYPPEIKTAIRRHEFAQQTWRSRLFWVAAQASWLAMMVAIQEIIYGWL